MDLPVNASARVGLTVGPADTAAALGSGDVAVFGTPRALALAEEATVRAVAAGLDPGETTVGTRVQLEHLAATPVGRSVEAYARLVTVDGRRLVFAVEIRDGDTLVVRGQVERIVVDREKFLRRADGTG